MRILPTLLITTTALALGGGADVHNYSVVLYHYPAAKGLFLKGGLGLSRAHVGRLAEEGASGSGLSVLLGAGCDFPIGKRAAITPIATFRFGGPSNLSGDEGREGVSGFRHEIIELGIGFSFY